MAKSQQTSTRITNHEIRLIPKMKAHFKRIEEEVFHSLGPPHQANLEVVDAEIPLVCHLTTHREQPYQVSTNRCQNMQTETHKIGKVRYNMQPRQTSDNLDLCRQEIALQWMDSKVAKWMDNIRNGVEDRREMGRIRDPMPKQGRLGFREENLHKNLSDTFN